MSFCERYINENSIEVEPITEGAIGTTVKGIGITIGALVAAVAVATKVDKVRDENFIKNNPQIKKIISDINNRCKDAIKKASNNDKYLKECPAKNIKPNRVNSKPTSITNTIFTVDYMKICEENGIGVDRDSYDSIIFNCDTEAAKKACAECKKELNEIKDVIKMVSEQIKSIENGNLVKISVDTFANNDEEYEYTTDADNNFIIGETVISVCVDIKPLINSKKLVNESTFENDPPREEQKKALSDLEFAYDKKYNAFCLSVSGYSIDRLDATLQKKNEELKTAKEEKQNAPTRYSRMAAQIKVDYLENVTNRCKAMIRKKKSYHKNEEKK